MPNADAAGKPIVDPAIMARGLLAQAGVDLPETDIAALIAIYPVLRARADAIHTELAGIDALSDHDR